MDKGLKLLRFLIPLFIIFPFLHAESWYDGIDIKIEASMYQPSLDGSILNNYSNTDLQNDFKYSKAKASYFGVEILLDYDYVPNIDINFLNMKDNKDTILTQPRVIADGDFNGTTSSAIEFSVLNTVIYQDFKQKGSVLSLFGKKFYSGDIEFDIGINIKLISWHYEIQDLKDLTKSSSWVKADMFIPLPYLGFKYYLYDITAFAQSSALSFSEAKSTNYLLGIDYLVIDDLYLSVSYLYEQFKAVQRQDTVDFYTKGYKFGFKYAF